MNTPPSNPEGTSAPHNSKFEELRTKRHGQIRRLKKWMRPLPRRATLHRYPFIKWFANTARKRSYLWSFRVSEVVPALYAGSVITIMPLQGVQIPLSFLASIIFRANLPIIVALQFVSNVFTLGPIYIADYYVGHAIISMMPWDEGGKELSAEEIQDIAEMEAQSKLESRTKKHVKQSLYVVSAAMLGGAILGLILGFILSSIYRLIVWRFRAQYKLYLHHKEHGG